MTFQDLAEIEKREPVKGCAVRFVHSENMTLAYWTIEPGAAIPEHAHPHEQIASIIEGTFELTIEGETGTLGPECVAVIPSGAIHSGRALTKCRVIDAFYPVREDYR